MHTFTLPLSLFTASYKEEPSTTEDSHGIGGIGGMGGGQNIGKSGPQGLGLGGGQSGTQGLHLLKLSFINKPP